MNSKLVRLSRIPQWSRIPRKTISTALPPPPPPTPTPTPTPKVKGFARVKALWTEYGIVAVGAYIGIYCSTLGITFCAIHYDVLNGHSYGIDPVSALEKIIAMIGESEYIPDLDSLVKKYPWVPSLVVADIITELTEPLRIMGTVALVPMLSRRFKKRV